MRNFESPKLKKWTKCLLAVGLIAIASPAFAEEAHGAHGKEAASEKKEAAPAKKEEAGKKEHAGKKEDGKTPEATEAGSKAENQFPEKEYYSREEVDALRASLEKKSTKLDQDMGAQKEYLDSLQKQVEAHLQKIDAARVEIADFMNARDEKEETKLKKLARFYEAMDAEQAAPLLQKVPDDLAIKIFDRMDTKKAGGVLALFPPPRAAKITAAFPRLRLQADKAAAAADAN